MRDGDENGSNLRGACLCGAVTFALRRDGLKPPDACHCSQCRKWSGHLWASVSAPLADLEIVDNERALAWYRASPDARRGFCRTCGSSLFWQHDQGEEKSERIAVALGAIEPPSGLLLAKHIFAVDKGDYYEIDDGLPQSDRE